MNKIYKAVLCALAISSSLCAIAEEGPYTVDGIQYTITDNEASLYYVVDQSNSVCNIPEAVTVNGVTYPVTSIGKGAFMGDSGIKKIVVPNSVHSIGALAFYMEDDLEELILGTGIKTVGTTAFEGNKSLKNVIALAPAAPAFGDITTEHVSDKMYFHINATSADSYAEVDEKIIAPDHVVLHTLAFDETAVTIDFEQISEYTIGYTTCTNPELESISNQFAYLTWSTSDANVAVVSKGGEVIPVSNGKCYISATDIFGNSDKISITVENLDNVFEVDGLRYFPNHDGDNTVTLYFAVDFGDNTTCYIPPTVEHNGVTYTVTSIGKGAFCLNECTQIYVPYTITSISDMAFYENNDVLQQLVIGSGVTTIGFDAFETCANLQNVISLNATAPSVALTAGEGEQAFENMTLHISADNAEAYSEWASHFKQVIYHKLTFDEEYVTVKYVAGDYQVPFSCCTDKTKDADNSQYSCLTWVSSDPDVATVDSNGVVTPVSDGTTTITATSIFGDSQTMTLTVEDTATSINKIACDSTNFRAFDLTGREVNARPLPHGIYVIVNADGTASKQAL